MDGILIIDKPAGPTSHDVVQMVKRVIGARKVGHTGTLDPAATGVLTLCIDGATKMAGELSGGEKIYEFTLVLGALTDTDDDTGKTIQQHPVEQHHLDELSKVVNSFVGEIDQVPPMYSARKVNGKRLYKSARQGQEVVRESRRIRIHEFTIEHVDGNTVSMMVRCDKGTYVRALCRDIGMALGCGGHAANIRRLKNGRFTIRQAIRIEDLKENWTESLIPV